jgi:hypothetical protein
MTQFDQLTAVTKHVCNWRSRKCDPKRDVQVLTQKRHWMFGRIFGLDGLNSYREPRLEPLCCPHCLGQGTAAHEQEYPRRKDRF